MADGEVRIEVLSSGSGLGERAAIKVNGQQVDIPGGYGPGLNAAVVDPSSGEVLQASRYDTRTDVTFQILAWIESIPPGRLVATALLGDAAANFTGEVRRAFTLLGSRLCKDLQPKQSWAVIGRKGAPRGSALEQLSAASPVTVTADLPLTDKAQDGTRITASSDQTSSRAEVTINGTVVLFSGNSASTDGMYAAVIDEATCKALSTHQFTTGKSSAAADEFADLVEGLPFGRMVAVTLNGDCVTHLTDRARKACDSLGSALIGAVQPYDSWSIVGFKGALPGSVAEARSAAEAVQSSYWNIPDPPNSTAGFPLALRSSGYLAQSTTSIVLGGVDIRELDTGLKSYGRGLNVAVLDEASGLPLHAETYDTCASTAAADAFAEMVEGLPAGRIVAVAVLDDAANSLTERARQACEMIGSAHIRALGYRESWAIIGRKGSAPGSVPESQTLNYALGVETWFALDPLRQTRLFNQIGVRSAGYEAGDSAAVTTTVNPRGVRFDQGYSRGLDVAVFDQDSGEVQSAAGFDTHESDAASDAFADLVERLPQGRVVAIAARDEAVGHLNERARTACEALGSGLIRTLGYRGSWAFVGRKGDTPTAVAETVCNSAPAACTYWLFPDDRYPGSGFNVSARSQGNTAGNSARISSRGSVIEIPGGYGRGLNVAVLDEQDGTLLYAQKYDTCASTAAADAFAEMVEGLPAGRIVAVAALDDAANSLTERARQACEMIGSGMIRGLAYRGSWCAVGVRGTAPGSALEQLDNTGGAALSAWFPLLKPQGRPELFPLLIGLIAWGALSVVALGFWAHRSVPPQPKPPPRPPAPATPLRYNELTHLTAHNAMSNRPDGWSALMDAAQNRTVSEQLAQGVRGLALDVHVHQPPGHSRDLYLCHGGCWWSACRNCGLQLRTFSQVLADIVAFLNAPANRKEIVTVFVESPAGWLPNAESNAMFLDSFTASGALDLIFWPDSRNANPPPQARVWNVNPSSGVFDWPTVDQMVAENKRLVLFCDRNTGDPASLYHIIPWVWRYVRETTYSDQVPFGPDLSCEERQESRNRQPNRSILLWNHFGTVPGRLSSSLVNSYNTLLGRAKCCAGSFGLVPNFVELDYVDIGSAEPLVQLINSRVWSKPAGDRLAALDGIPPLPTTDLL